jgi:hypothetical protein
MRKFGKIAALKSAAASINQRMRRRIIRGGPENVSVSFFLSLSLALLALILLSAELTE